MRKGWQTGIVLAGLAAGKLLALVRDIYFTAAFGTDAEAAAYELVSRVPNLLYELTLSGVILGMLLPILGGRVRRGKDADGVLLTARFCTVALPILLLCSALGYFFAPGVVQALTGDWDAAHITLAATLLQALVFTLPVVAMIAVFTVWLQANGNLGVPAVAAALPAVVALGYLIAAGAAADIFLFVRAVVVGMVLEAGVVAAVALTMWWRMGGTPISSPALPQAKRFARRSVPVLAASWVQPISSTATLFAIGRWTDPQTVAYYGYATRISVSLTAVFVFLLGSLFFPRLVREKDTEARRVQTLAACRNLFGLLLPMVVGGVFVAEQGIALLYGRGAFDNTDVARTAMLLRFALLACLPAVANEWVLKLHYAAGDYGRPLRAALWGLGAELFLLLPLAAGFGGVGVLLAVASGGVVRAVAGVRTLPKLALPGRAEFPAYLWILAGTGVMAFLLMALPPVFLLEVSVGALGYALVIGVGVWWTKRRYGCTKERHFPKKGGML